MKRLILYVALCLFWIANVSVATQAQNTTSKTVKTVKKVVKKNKKKKVVLKKTTVTKKKGKVNLSDKPSLRVNPEVKKAVEKPKVVAVAKEEEKPSVPKPTLSFAETSRDFGDITQGDKVSHVFKFQNTGTAPLIISNVQTTCGCTVPEWPKEPIAPGASGEIAATFNSANKSGIQNKVITIYSNASNDQTTVKIIANVLQPKKTEGQPSTTPAPQPK